MYVNKLKSKIHTFCQTISTMALKVHCSFPWFLVKCSQNLTQFSQVSNSYQKSQTVLGIFKQFSEVSNSSRKSQTFLGSFKQFSEGSNNSRNLQTALKSPKQFSEVSNSSRQSQTVLAVLNSSRFLPIRFIISCYFQWSSLIVVTLASKVGSC